MADELGKHELEHLKNIFLKNFNYISQSKKRDAKFLHKIGSSLNLYDEKVSKNLLFISESLSEAVKLSKNLDEMLANIICYVALAWFNRIKEVTAPQKVVKSFKKGLFERELQTALSMMCQYILSSKLPTSLSNKLNVLYGRVSYLPQYIKITTNTKTDVKKVTVATRRAGFFSIFHFLTRGSGYLPSLGSFGTIWREYGVKPEPIDKYLDYYMGLGSLSFLLTHPQISINNSNLYAPNTIANFFKKEKGKNFLNSGLHFNPNKIVSTEEAIPTLQKKICKSMLEKNEKNSEFYANFWQAIPEPILKSQTFEIQTWAPIKNSKS